ncbi:MAG TPA: hypothetical protein VK206_13350 [Anaerolineales bacterium]|nr:hypothetical protein [Anaerolineales bacterium]
MKTQTARTFKTLSFVLFLLTIFFLAFFDNSKHIPALALVNPFADDPYDAVGSFGIQLSFLAAWLSLIRAFRPYTVKEFPPTQQLLILRGETVVLLSIFVTLMADIIAMIRYPLMWMNSPAGWILAGLVSGLVLLTILMGLLLYRVAINSSISFANRSWARAILFLISVLILAAYPADFLESILGGILSALLGMVTLFVATWAPATAIFPDTEMEFEDVLDDFKAIYREIKARVRLISSLEKLTNANWLHRLLDWLNPRKHKWNFIILLALAMGGALMLVEVVNEGMSTNLNTVLLIPAIFLSIEGMGVLLGYYLFAEFLGIFRKE